MAFAFTRQPMKRNLTWSSTAFLSQLKFWFAKKNWRWTCVFPRQIRAFANYPDHAKVLVLFKRWWNCLILSESCCLHNNQHFVEKSRQTTMRDSFPIRDYLRLEFVKKVLLKEETLPHYQNSRFFRKQAKSNKMSRPLQARNQDFFRAGEFSWD